jgi:hypothetical protein
MKLELLRAKRIRTGSSEVFSCEIPRQYMEMYKAILLKSPERVKITIEPATKRRSTGEHSQNHRLNGFIQQICNSTGNDFDMIKMVVKLRAIDKGYPFETLLTGDRFPKSERESTISECSILIQEVEQLAAEEGIVLVEV